MEDEETCGKGLAGNSIVPSKMSQFLFSLAKNLRIHMESLELKYPNARLEHDAYASLVGEYENVASNLAATAEEMASY